MDFEASKHNSTHFEFVKLITLMIHFKILIIKAIALLSLLCIDLLANLKSGFLALGWPSQQTSQTAGPREPRAGRR